MRILVIGAGVIGSVYAGRLLDAGNSVTVCARGRRLAELRESGLVLEDATTGQRIRREVAVVEAADAGQPCDLVVVALRHDQMLAAAPMLRGLRADVLFFGNAAGLTTGLSELVGRRAMFGFPGAAGTRDGEAVRFVLIRQQKTMLADADRQRSPRVRSCARLFRAAGFPVTVSGDGAGWLVAHAAFIVPIAFALYRVDAQPGRLATDETLLATMVTATRQLFRALRAADNHEIPANLRWLYLRLPQRFSVRYWRRMLEGPRGELWFAAHARAAPEEMTALAEVLRSAIDKTGRSAPALDWLLSGHGH